MIYSNIRCLFLRVEIKKSERLSTYAALPIRKQRMTFHAGQLMRQTLQLLLENVIFKDSGVSLFTPGRKVVKIITIPTNVIKILLFITIYLSMTVKKKK